VIFDNVEYIIMEWTMPNEKRISRMCRRVLPKKRRTVVDQFAVVKYRSETNFWTQKLNREYYGVDRYFFAFSWLRFETQPAEITIFNQMRFA
jgi:hypothetical protein